MPSHVENVLIAVATIKELLAEPEYGQQQAGAIQIDDQLALELGFLFEYLVDCDDNDRKALGLARALEPSGHPVAISASVITARYVLLLLTLGTIEKGEYTLSDPDRIDVLFTTIEHLGETLAPISQPPLPPLELKGHIPSLELLDGLPAPSGTLTLSLKDGD